MKGIVLAGGSSNHDFLSEVSVDIETIEKRQGFKVSYFEMIAYEKGWITADTLRKLAKLMVKNQCAQYLLG